MVGIPGLKVSKLKFMKQFKQTRKQTAVEWMIAGKNNYLKTVDFINYNLYHSIIYWHY